MLELNSSWLPVEPKSDFSIHNLPVGVFSWKYPHSHLGIAIGDQIIDLVVAQEIGLFKGLVIDPKVFERTSLNHFIACGKNITSEVRRRIQQALVDCTSTLKEYEQALIPQTEVCMHVPVEVGDYTDFYSSMEHAINVGKMFRDPENALLPNWKHLPVGYHGRASSIITTETPLHRPKGQQMPKGAS